MSDDDDLTAFLAARLDENEAAAHYSGPARVAWLTYRDDEGRMLYTTVAAADDHGTQVAAGSNENPWIADGHELPPPASARVVYDPAQELRDVEADRKLLSALRQAAEYSDRMFGPTPPDGIASGEWPGERMRAATQVLTLTYVARIRAERFSGHPDYRPGWAPDANTV